MSRTVHSRPRIGLEHLEDRLTPSATAPDVDLTAHGTTGAINEAIFRQFDAQPTGSGVIDSFVRLQAPNAKTSVQQGFNTDARPLQFDENRSPVFTRSLRLDQVPEVNIGGVQFREFLLDINQKASQPFLSLDELRFFVGDRPDLAGYDADQHQLAGLDAVYDLDYGGDHWVKLNARLNQGSGKGDALVYIPSCAFVGDGDYLYLYSKFGVNCTGNAGFEEWATAKSSLTCDTGTIVGSVKNQDGQGMADVVMFLDADNDGALDDNEVYTTTDQYGNYSFQYLAAGLGDFTTYRVRQVVPADYTQISENPADIRLDTCNAYVAQVDFINRVNDDDTGGGSGGGEDLGGGDGDGGDLGGGQLTSSDGEGDGGGLLDLGPNS